MALGRHQVTRNSSKVSKHILLGYNSQVKVVDRDKGIRTRELCEYMEMLETQSCPSLCGPMDCNPQAPLSMEFFRQECWSGQPFLSQGDCPRVSRRSSPGLLHCRQILSHLSHLGSHKIKVNLHEYLPLVVKMDDSCLYPRKSPSTTYEDQQL